jgi:2-C-methyl-D-erythritol 4-phosphate cytidylyltransferase/2-C-methyl-D-erythritol 2,4-cyclodiphosphate synthase
MTVDCCFNDDPLIAYQRTKFNHPQRPLYWQFRQIRFRSGLDMRVWLNQKGPMRFVVIIVAGGAGLRAGGDAPKQWRALHGKPLVCWSVEAFLAAGAEQVFLVAPANAQARAAELCAGLPNLAVVRGGAERADSVQAGLSAIGERAIDAVLIHDAARPFVTAEHISGLLAALETADGALPALSVSDTLKRADERLTVTSSPPRDGLWRAQTPQAFRWPLLRDAYAARGSGDAPTDDAQVVEKAGGRVVLVAGDPLLMKATYPEDFEMMERLAGGARITRSGMGYDAHRFGPGSSVWLCGVEIPHTHGLVGHSDADAGLHALTDALLGAVGEGDIGDHFPPIDPKWRGASSDLFLKHAADLVAGKGGRIVNVDVTLICERPKIKPHRAAMRERVAAILDLPLDRVSVKATTTEGMGFTGREEGIAAQAIANVETAV